jgi:CubicO group peptidase (beta-lactamase class C family)
MKRTLAGVVALLACACASSTSIKTKPAAAAGQAPTCRSELQAAQEDPANSRAVALLVERMKARRIPGLQAAVVKHGRIVMLQSCGIANLEYDAPVLRDTRFQIASATKPFTGVAVMQLVAGGKLKLDAPVADYLDGLPEAWRKVTVRQAMMHVSGLPDVVDPMTGKTLDPSGFEATWTRVMKEPMQFETGTAYRYNQTNYVLLGRIITKASGMPFQDFIRERQFKPAGMTSAVFADGADIIPKRAGFYGSVKIVDGKPVEGSVTTRFPEFPQELRTGAGLTTTAEEIARWIMALNRGELLPPDARKEMWTTGHMPDGKPTAWALGWPAISRAEHPAVAGIGGGAVAFYVYPQDDVAVVILTNLSGGQPEQMIENVAALYGEAAAK